MVPMVSVSPLSSVAVISVSAAKEAFWTVTVSDSLAS
jgi:hypothetical protein